MKARLPQGYGGGPSNMNQMIRKAQKVQEDVQKIQAELEEKDFIGTAGGGAVEVTVTGKKAVKSVKLKPEVVDPEDIEMLEDLIVAAFNEAMRSLEEESNARIDEATGGFTIPGLF